MMPKVKATKTSKTQSVLQDFSEQSISPNNELVTESASAQKSTIDFHS